MLMPFFEIVRDFFPHDFFQCFKIGIIVEFRIDLLAEGFVGRHIVESVDKGAEVETGSAGGNRKASA